jgi:catechol-2,3-dioxygenase
MNKLALLILALLPLYSHGQLATPNADGIRFGHVHLNVPDAEQHAALWEEHFGGERTPLGSQIAIRNQAWVPDRP